VDGGFLVNLRRTGNQSGYVVPEWDDGKMLWKSGYLVLRGSRDLRDLVSASPQTGGGWGPDGSGAMVINGSIAYHGQLQIVCVPRGSTFSVTLSDVENPRTPSSLPSGNWGSYPDWRHGVGPLPREEAELVPR
jgi:hypothetical protein